MTLDRPRPNELEPFAAIGLAEAERLAATHGTPLFVYDEPFFEARVKAFLERWRAHFPDGAVYLSYKTNYMSRLCRRAHELGLGADVVSGYELEHALKLGATAEAVFNGPLKRPIELRRAVQAGVGVNIDLVEEIETLRRLREAGEIPAPRLGLRVNPGRPVYDSMDASFVAAHRARQAAVKFGWPIEGGQAEEVAERIEAAGFSLRMIHAHLNSQITNADLMLEALAPVLDFAARLRAQGYAIDELNVGGGFGVPGMVRAKRGWWADLKQEMGEPLGDEPSEGFDLERFCTGLKAALSARALEGLRIACEPGRYLFSPSCALLSQVVGVKRTAQKTWLIIDAGLHIMPTASFGETRRLRFLRPGVAEMPVGTDGVTCALGGPLCYEGDVVMPRIAAPADAAAGDLVLISDAGAYTVSRSTNFNQPRAAVALRDGGDGVLIWRRETYEDIFSFECGDRP